MKRILTILLIALLASAFTACNPDKLNSSSEEGSAVQNESSSSPATSGNSSSNSAPSSGTSSSESSSPVEASNPPSVDNPTIGSDGNPAFGMPPEEPRIGSDGNPAAGIPADELPPEGGIAPPETPDTSIADGMGNPGTN